MEASSLRSSSIEVLPSRAFLSISPKELVKNGLADVKGLFRTNYFISLPEDYIQVIDGFLIEDDSPAVDPVKDPQEGPLHPAKVARGTENPMHAFRHAHKLISRNAL